MNIPFLSFDYMHGLLRKQAIDVFTQFYDDQYYILGKGIDEFEKKYAEFNNTKYCVGLSNGLDALYIALKALGIGAGDEVIVPSNTYIATALAVAYTGARPIFAEPDIKTYNLSAASAKLAITTSTKAIIPVHLYGQACNMHDIMQLAEQNNLFVIEDNAQSHGAMYKNQMTGTFGHINATSFYPGKNLGALGDAGAVTTNDSGLALQAQLLRNYGSNQKYYNEIIGFNKRLDEFQARFLLLKLQYLPAFTESRMQIASLYNYYLNSIDDVITPFVAEGATHVYHLYVIRTKKRDTLQTYLKQKGIGTLIHYPVPPHLQKAFGYLGLSENDFPVAEELAKTSLSLPIYPGLTETEVIYICQCIKDFFAC